MSQTTFLFIINILETQQKKTIKVFIIFYGFSLVSYSIVAIYYNIIYNQPALQAEMTSNNLAFFFIIGASVTSSGTQYYKKSS